MTRLQTLGVSERSPSRAPILRIVEKSASASHKDEVPGGVRHLATKAPVVPRFERCKLHTRSDHFRGQEASPSRCLHANLSVSHLVQAILGRVPPFPSYGRRFFQGDLAGSQKSEAFRRCRAPQGFPFSIPIRSTKPGAQRPAILLIVAMLRPGNCRPSSPSQRNRPDALVKSTRSRTSGALMPGRS